MIRRYLGLVAVGIAGRSVPHAAAAPYQAWLAAWHQLAAGSAVLAATTSSTIAAARASLPARRSAASTAIRLR